MINRRGYTLMWGTNYARFCNSVTPLATCTPFAYSFHLFSLVLQGVLHGMHDGVSPLLEVLAKIEGLQSVLIHAVEIGAVPQQLLNNLKRTRTSRV